MIKKIISIVFILILCANIIKVNAVHAKADEPNPVTFFESIDSLLKLNNYSIKQTFTGGLSLNDGSDIDGNYKFIIDSDILKKDDYKRDINSTIRGHINLRMKGEDKAFDNLIINVRGKVIIYSGKEMFVQLQHADLFARGVPEAEKENYNEFREELKTQINKFKGKWVHFSNDLYNEYYSTFNLEISDTESLPDEEEIIKSLQKEGFRKTIESYTESIIDLSIKNSGMTDEEAASMKEIFNEILKVKFFKTKTIKAGDKKGFTSFRINRSGLLMFIKKVAKITEETLPEEGVSIIKGYLEKFSLSGAYHEDKNNRIIDEFKVRLSFKDLMLLKHLQITYNEKISQINSLKRFRKPTNATPIEDLINTYLLPMGF